MWICSHFFQITLTSFIWAANSVLIAPVVWKNYNKLQFNTGLFLPIFSSTHSGLCCNVVTWENNVKKNKSDCLGLNSQLSPMLTHKASWIQNKVVYFSIYIQMFAKVPRLQLVLKRSQKLEFSGSCAKWIISIHSPYLWSILVLLPWWLRDWFSEKSTLCDG